MDKKQIWLRFENRPFESERVSAHWQLLLLTGIKTIPQSYMLAAYFTPWLGCYFFCTLEEQMHSITISSELPLADSALLFCRRVPFS